MLTKQELQAEVRAAREAVLIVNTHSRRGEQSFQAAKAGLAARDIRVVEAHPVKSPADLSGRVAAAVEAGHRLVIVGGGDGTLSSISGHFAYRDSVLAVLPLGTGNSFARTLSIPQTLEGALDVIALSRVADVDLGMVNGRYFTNAVTLGLSAHVAEHTPGPLKRVFGPLSYLATGVAETVRHEAFEAIIDDGRTKQQLMTHQIIVANGHVFGATPIFTDALIDNRRLALVTLRGIHRWQIVKMWLSLLSGKMRQFRDTQAHFVTQCTIMTNPPQHIDIDGESVEDSPAHFSVAVEALRVLVPESFRDVSDERV